MAEDTLSPPTKQNAERVNRDYSWLTPTNLPKFLADRLEAAWREVYPGLKLKPHSPQDEAYSPGITWRIARRVPGRGREDSQKGSVKHQTTITESAEVIQLYTQIQTVTYEFTLFDKDVENLHELTDAFENFMQLIQAEVQPRGVENLLFEEEIREDLVSTRRSEDTPKRVLRYTAYVHKRFEIAYPMISRIKLYTRNDIEEIQDRVILRADKILVDTLDIPLETPLLTRVSLLDHAALNQQILEAQESSGALGVQLVAAQYVYAPDVDYKLITYLLPTGRTTPAILWSKGEGARRPDVGTAYYISFHQAVEVKTTTIR